MYRQDPANSGETSTLYARSSPRIARAAWPGTSLASLGAWPPTGPTQHFCELGFNGAEVGIEQFRPRDHDNVEALGDGGPPKDLTEDAFGPVPNDRATELARGRDAQAADRPVAQRDDGRHQSGPDPVPRVVDTLELHPSSDTARGGESLARGGRRALHGRTPAV